jgi:hypothetical protein
VVSERNTIAERNTAERNPLELAKAIEDFVAGCELPALLERGAVPLALNGEQFRIEIGRKGLWLEAWDQERLWSRRILAAKQVKRKRLELEAFRFGKRPVRVSLVDAADSRSTAALDKAQRSVFAERFRLFLNRQFGAWRLEEYRWEADLENSLSPLYPTACFTRGQETVAALGAPPRDTSFHALTFALIYLDSLRQKHTQAFASRLVLYLPEEFASPVVQLARRLNPSEVKIDIWTYTPHGVERLLDPLDCGNLSSRLALRASSLAGPAWWQNFVREFPEVECLEEASGDLSYRIRGYEVARLRQGLGNEMPPLAWGTKLRKTARETDTAAIRTYFRDIARRRQPKPSDPLDPVYTSAPELWLESSVRANLPEIDATLTGQVYGQILQSEAGQQGRADLLGITGAGQLAVIELKANEDIHLPLQAFAYWLRIKQHLRAGDFPIHGYFPGQVISQASPKLFLVAPALYFHPTTKGILNFLPIDCRAEMVGLSANWRQRADVALRM